MKKDLLSIIFCVVIIGSAVAQTKISDVRHSGSWYRIYDTNGKQIKTLSSSVGELIGFCAEFIIVKNKSWYYLYDSTGKRYKTLPVSIGKVTAVSGGRIVAATYELMQNIAK